MVNTADSSVGVVLPKKALAKLNMAKDDTFYLIDASNSSMRIKSQHPDFSLEMDVA